MSGGVLAWLSVVIWGTDLHVAQLMPLPLTVSCFSKIQIGVTFLVPAHPGSPGQRAVKQVCVYATKCINIIFACPPRPQHSSSMACKPNTSTKNLVFWQHIQQNSNKTELFSWKCTKHRATPPEDWATAIANMHYNWWWIWTCSVKDMSAECGQIHRHRHTRSAQYSSPYCWWS